MTDDAQDILAAARRRADAREVAHVPIDYKGAQVMFRKQKAALTRAINSHDPDKIVLACKKAVGEWSKPPFNGAWPDDWSNWQRALDDALGWRSSVQLTDL